MRISLLFAGLLTAAIELSAQQRADQAEAQPAPRSGIRLDGLSIYSQGDLMRPPRIEPTGSRSDLWLFSTGSAGDVSALFGRRSQLSLGYHGGYNFNQRYSGLNGANHRISIGIQSDPARHTIFTAGATGETGLISDGLFDPSYTLSLARRARSLDQLRQGLSAGDPAGILDSAVELALAGGRRKGGEAHVNLSHSFSRRFTTEVNVRVAREIHSYSREQQFASRYPNVTIGTATLGITYALTRRTRLRSSANYAKSYSRQYRADWESLDLGIEREFGRRSFGSIEGGYARMSDRTTDGFGRGTYTLAGIYGTTAGRHTVAVMVRRGAGDFHGLGSQATLALNGAWSWMSARSAWSFGGSCGYERLSGGAFGSLEAIISQANATRALSAHFDVVLTAIYMAHSSFEFDRLSRAGLRLTVAWRPSPRRRR